MCETVQDLCLQNSAVILPAVSNADIPQMAIELLINTLHPILIGFVHQEYLKPSSEPNELNDEDDVTAASIAVYYEGKHHLVFLQMRGYIVPGYESNFNESICDWMRFFQPRKVLTLLSATEVGERTEGVNVNPIRPFTLNFDELNLELRENEAEFCLYEPLYCEVDPNMIVPHYGFDQNFHIFAHDKGLPSLGIMVINHKETSEEEAVLIGESVKNYLGLDINEWVKPISWGMDNGSILPNEVLEVQ